MKKIFILVIALGLVFVQSTNCFSATRVEVTEEIPLTPATTTCYQEMWHYAGGYWIVNSGTDYETKVTDKEMSGTMNIKNFLIANEILLKIKLPLEVVNVINYGDRVTFEPAAPDGYNLSDFFDVDSFHGNISNGYVNLYATPVANGLGTASFKSFNSAFPNVPLIDYTYGTNIYKIYQSQKYLAVAQGAYHASSTSKTEPYYIHPSMIKSSSGLLKDRNKITVGAKSVQTSSHYIGNGTFAKGGDVGCKFKLPLKINFTAHHDSWYWDYSDEQPTEPVLPPEPVDLPSWRIHRSRNNL